MVKKEPTKQKMSRPREGMASRVKKMIAAERKINGQLFFVSSGVTLVVMSLFLVQFFTRGAFPPQEIGFFYLGVVLIYVLHKEMFRWMAEEKKIRRRGEFFVYGWVVFTMALYIVNFFSKNYFSYSANGEEIHVLEEIASITLQVFAIFLITRGLKLFNVTKKRKKR